MKQLLRKRSLNYSIVLFSLKIFVLELQILYTSLLNFYAFMLIWIKLKDIILLINLINFADVLSSYKLQLDIIRQDFKSGLENLLKTNPIRAIFLGVRIGDPTAVWHNRGPYCDFLFFFIFFKSMISCPIWHWYLMQFSVK